MRQRGCAFFDTASLFLHMSHYRNDFQPPFPIPDSWEWVTIGDISSSILYGVSESAKDNGQYKLLRITDIQNNQVNWRTVPSTDFPPGKVVPYILHKGDILFARTGATVGKSYLVNQCPPNTIYASYLIRIQTFQNIEPAYLKFFFESGFYWQQISEGSVGIGQPNVNGTSLSLLKIPIPPKSEQMRIVGAIQNVLSTVDSIEAGKQSTLTSVNQAKSKILELAMQGKLVPQDPSDEPAADMLRRVNPKARIITDNPHYPQLPDNWVISSIGDIFAINPKNIAKDSTLAGFVPMASIEDGYSDSFEYTPKEWGEIKNGFTHFADGDIAVAKISPCLENRKSMILRGLPNGIGSGTTELLVFRSKVIYPPYGLLFFKSSSFISKCVGTFNGVVGQQRVNKTIVGAMPIPIPPYNEQKQIVEKVNQLFIFLDAMQSNLSD